ncbi:MAG TPA: hypothetical protein VGD46_13470 [Rhizobacter sp.]
MKKSLQPLTIGKDTIKGRALHLLAEGQMVYRPTAADVTAGNFKVKCTEVPAAVEVVVYSAVATKRAWDGAVTLSGKELTINNAGTTDWAAGDRVVIKAYFD